MEEKMAPAQAQQRQLRIEMGRVHCLICTHTVEAEIVTNGEKSRIRLGQTCPRCASSLDAGYVVELARAA